MLRSQVPRPLTTTRSPAQPLLLGLSPRVAVGLVASGGLGLAASVDLVVDDGPDLCPFRLCTGGYCPACGGTRAAARFVSGDIAGSFAQHPIVALLMIQALVAAGFILWRPERSLRWMNQRLGRFASAMGVLALAVWVARMAIGDIPAPFGL